MGITSRRKKSKAQRAIAPPSDGAWAREGWRYASTAISAILDQRGVCRGGVSFGALTKRWRRSGVPACRLSSAQKLAGYQRRDQTTPRFRPLRSLPPFPVRSPLDLEYAEGAKAEPPRLHPE